ncbi:MAG: deoxyribose-phosphate aldolase [Acidimicrobiia bacterium]|nr:deoxyribose-phosphate aldolase [Acidimicrobiia bacterium]
MAWQRIERPTDRQYGETDISRGMTMSSDNLAGSIDHTLVDPTANAAAVANAVNTAIHLGCASVWLNPGRITLATDIADGAIILGSVIGFPFGATTTSTKVAEAGTAAADGATELDMVLDLGRFLDGNTAGAGRDIAAVRETAGEHLLTVTIESAALDNDEIVEAARLAVANGADFVKTSTGHHPAGGATPTAVALIREAVGADRGVKASGGIRTLADVKAMLAAGATRIATSATAEILRRGS